MAVEIHVLIYSSLVTIILIDFKQVTFGNIWFELTYWIFEIKH